MAAAHNVWVVMSFGADASWEGNTGYSDDIPTRYQFNSSPYAAKRAGCNSRRALNATLSARRYSCALSAKWLSLVQGTINTPPVNK